MNPTPLEAAVLSWLRESTATPELVAQLREAVIVSREFSGAGSYTGLAVPAQVPPLPASVKLVGSDGPINGPEVESHELPWPACTMLWFTARKAATLEIAGSGIVDAHPNAFTLSAPTSDA